jgi:uncharacterized protein (TIGR03084 family)
MGADIRALTRDLAAETADLVPILRGLAEKDWARDTPAAGWTIRDQISHLAFFDEAATLSATDPERFRVETGQLITDGPDAADRVAARFAGLPGEQVLAWFLRAREEYLAVFSTLDPSARVPWFGPTMSAAASVTARLMETWAHGQDVVDALGLSRRPTSRLRHVAHLGVRTLGWSFQIRDLPEPQRPVRVELLGPDGEQWTWGPADAADRVSGRAEDFCLLVTQRRHRDECGLTAAGPVASTWLDIAQAFAGPPGSGRPQPDPVRQTMRSGPSASDERAQAP